MKDASANEPGPFAYVHLEEINRTTRADRTGKFTFRNIPVGTYTLTLHRVGFKNYKSKYPFNCLCYDVIENLLMPGSTSGDEVTVTRSRDKTTGSRLEHASTKILGEELRRNLCTTLSETLRNEPGFSERSPGPAPGRPVIRGLGGERVLILRDGERIGDVSAQIADHAVSIDTVGAEEIEIARGPAALAYGANAIGGVINVVKNEIPNTVPNLASSLEELYSKRPHLASFSFEIGNPDLDPERGVGIERFLRHSSDRVTAELALYRNQFQNYLYTRDTGERNVSDPSLNNCQFVGESARLNGVEFSTEISITNRFKTGVEISYTVAEGDVSEEEQ